MTIQDKLAPYVSKNAIVCASSHTKTAELVSFAYRNSERLINLVNDILDMERLSAARIDFKIAAADLREMLLEAEEVNLEPRHELRNPVEPGH